MNILLKVEREEYSSIIMSNQDMYLMIGIYNFKSKIAEITAFEVLK